jgi:Zn-dependent protease/predicted transcriptional regulator
VLWHVRGFDVGGAIAPAHLRDGGSPATHPPNCKMRAYRVPTHHKAPFHGASPGIAEEQGGIAECRAMALRRPAGDDSPFLRRDILARRCVVLSHGKRGNFAVPGPSASGTPFAGNTVSGRRPRGCCQAGGQNRSSIPTSRSQRMFGRGIPLFTLFGFSVKVDMSWFIIAILITWSLAVGLFPRFLPDRSTASYWWMGVFGALGLFASIVVHEFSHSLVARTQGIEMRGITLFIFGGVAEMDEEPPNPRAELLVALAGPAASVAVAALAGIAAWIAGAAAAPVEVAGVLWYLAAVNLLLVAFNMLPAFPLDGGRVFRAMLWQLRGSLKWATRVTSAIGSFFGIFLIVMGVVSFIGGNFVGGVWWFLLGMFLRAAAQASYQQLLMRRVLEHEPVRRLMMADVKAVPPDLTVEHLVDEHIYKHHFNSFPVVEDGRILGCVTIGEVKRTPRDQWSTRTVREVMAPCTDDNTIGPDEDAIRALRKMQRHGASRLLVVADGRLEGILTNHDLMRLISLKLELEEVE